MSGPNSGGRRIVKPPIKPVPDDEKNDDSPKEQGGEPVNPPNKEPKRPDAPRPVNTGRKKKGDPVDGDRADQENKPPPDTVSSKAVGGGVQIKKLKARRGNDDEDIDVIEIDSDTLQELAQLLAPASKSKSTTGEEAEDTASQEPDDPLSKSKQERINKILRRPPKYAVSELEDYLSTIDLTIQDMQSLRRNAVLQVDPKVREAVQAACEEIARAKWPGQVFKGVKILLAVASIALAVVTHGAALGLIAVPIIIAKVAHGVSAAKTVAALVTKLVDGYRAESQELRETGMKELEEWSGISHMSPSDREQFQTFRAMAASRLKAMDDEKIAQEKDAGK